MIIAGCCCSRQASPDGDGRHRHDLLDPGGHGHGLSLGLGFIIQPQLLVAESPAGRQGAQGAGVANFSASSAAPSAINLNGGLLEQPRASTPMR